MKLARIGLAIILSLVLLVSIGSPVQAKEDNAEVELKVEVIYPPLVATSRASPVGSSWTVLHGTLTDMGTASSVDVYFEWGENTDYSSGTTPVRIMRNPGAFWATITGLTPTTTYHFRPVAVGDSTSYGEDMTFTTRSPPPPGPPAPPPIPPAPPGTTNVRGMVTTAGVFLEPVTATSEDELCTLTIPEGTVGLTEELEPLDEITIVIMDEPPPLPEEAHIVGLAYDLGPDKATFELPITLTISYDPDALPEGVAEEDLVIAYYDEEAGEWVELDGVVDTVNNTITASVPHFTTFAVIGMVPAPAPPALARFTISSLGVSPSELAPGEEVNISVLVANTGGKSGSYQVTLVINDLVEATKEVTVRAGLSKEVTFSVTKDEPNTYAVTVDGLSGSFTVVSVEVPPAPAAFSVSRLSIQPAEVEAATAATIAVLVSNTGGTEGSYTVVLKVNGVKEAEKTVTIAAGDSQEVSFTLTREEPGTYSVSVDGLSGGFTVIVVTPPPGINWPLNGGIIGAVVIVAGLLIYFLVFRRKAYSPLNHLNG